MSGGICRSGKFHCLGALHDDAPVTEHDEGREIRDHELDGDHAAGVVHHKDRLISGRMIDPSRILAASPVTRGGNRSVGRLIDGSSG